MITISGNEIDKSEIRLTDYLRENNLQPNRIAVEVNEQIVSKSEYDTTVLKDGDVVEIVHFVGGG